PAPRKPTYRPTPRAEGAPAPRPRRIEQGPKKLSFTEQLKARLLPMFDRRYRVTPDDIVVFTRQFAAMVGSGLPLHQSLYFYGESDDETGMGPIIQEVADKVGEGTTLSGAMRLHPEVFSEVYVGLMAAGEATGMLSPILNKLADLQERNQKLRKKVISTFTYPALLLTVSGGCILAFLYFVLPMMVPLFSSLKVDLPWPTRVLLMVSEVVKSPMFLVLLLGLPVLAFLFYPALKNLMTANPTRLRSLHRIPLDIPYVGRLLEKIVAARILFSLATLLDSGYALAACLEKCERVAGNAEVAFRIRKAREQLVEGCTAAECLGNNHVLPPGAVQMISVGEESAQLSEMVRKVAAVYEDDVELALMDLASLLEPMILIGMGLLVGFVVLAAVLPTVSLLNHL
ncbi:MAG: type II secretion system F family protein, partial [Candidatus Eremiobacterota bacterium]